MKIFSLVIFFIYSSIAFAIDEIWLQDTDCKMLSSNGIEVKLSPGSLITYICTKDGTVITCSNTAKNKSMLGNKPSAINTYNEIIKDEEFAIWKATSYEGVFIFNIKDKRYSTTSTYLLPALINKHCVGEIKSY